MTKCECGGVERAEGVVRGGAALVGEGIVGKGMGS